MLRSQKKLDLLPTYSMVRLYPMERLTRADLLLAENLRTLIAARRVDASDVAQACGHSAAWISKILNGDRGMRVQDVGKVAAFFGLTVSEMFSPGISAVTERRRRTRRVVGDRRMIVDRRNTKKNPTEVGIALVKNTVAEPYGAGVKLSRPALTGGVLHGDDGDQRSATLDISRASMADLDARVTAHIESIARLHQLRKSALASALGASADGSARVEQPHRADPHAPARRRLKG